MDVFLVKLSLILSHIATAMLPLIMNNLPQKYIHSGLIFVIKHPLKSGESTTSDGLPASDFLYRLFYNFFTVEPFFIM